MQLHWKFFCQAVPAILAVVYFGGCNTLADNRDSNEIYMGPLRGVMLDAGHGGEPSEAASLNGGRYSSLGRGARMGLSEECYGAISAEGYKEKTATLAICQKVKTLLEREGLQTAMTRSSDTYIPLNERVAKLNSGNYRDWVFVSIHFNRSHSKQQATGLSAKYKKPNGFELYVLPQRGQRSTNGSYAPRGFLTVNHTRSSNLALARSLQSSLRNAGIHDRGIREAWFVVLRGSPMPAVLVEGGFMSNPEEGKAISTEEYQWKFARAIVDGIRNLKSGTGTRASINASTTPES